MQVTAFLAESVTVADGKLFAHRAGLGVVRAARVPAVVPRIGIGMILTEAAAGAEVNVVVRLVDGDGNDCRLTSAAVAGGQQPVDAENVDISVSIPDDDDAVVVLAVTMDNLVLPALGRYRFQVSADGAVAVTVPLLVTED